MTRNTLDSKPVNKNILLTEQPHCYMDLAIVITLGLFLPLPLPGVKLSVFVLRYTPQASPNPTLTERVSVLNTW